MLVNITGGADLTLGEVHQINEIIHDAVGDDAEIIFGAVHEPAMQGEIRVTVIATGFDRAVDRRPAAQPRTSGAARRAQLPAATGAAYSTPGIAAPQPQPAARAAAAAMPPGARAAGSTEVPEMEIPTFIRRQMD